MCSSLGIHHERPDGNRKSVPTRSVVTTQAGQRAPVIQRIRRAHARRASRRPPPKLQRRPLPPAARWHRTTCDVCANRCGREARPNCSRPTRAAGSSTRGVGGSGGPLAARVCAPHPRLALEGQLSTTRSEPSGTTLNRGSLPTTDQRRSGAPQSFDRHLSSTGRDDRRPVRRASARLDLRSRPGG